MPKVIHVDFKGLLNVKPLSNTSKMVCTFNNPFGANFTKTVEVTIQQIQEWTAGFGDIQSIMPQLSKDESEWFITGIEDFDKMFGECE